MISLEQIEQISKSVGERVGWDFSRMRTQRAPTPWEYANVVRQFVTDTECVLDIGTGGGERFLTLAPYFRKGVGIDQSTEMIKQAMRNKEVQNVANVDFKLMDANHLEFPDAEMGMVLNRHCSVNVDEIVRVLRSRGYFVTQQVGDRNTLNFLQAFGWTLESFGDEWGQRMEELVLASEQSGCRVVAEAEYDVRYWFCDVESLVFWLKSVPLPEPFDVDKHWEGVNRILNDYKTIQGIETNEHRELLIVEKRQ